MIIALLISLNALASSPGTSEFTHFSCNFDEITTRASLGGRILQGRFKLYEIYDSINRQQHDFRNLPESTEPSPTPMRDGSLALPFDLKGPEAGYSYTIFLLGSITRGPVKARLLYVKSDGTTVIRSNQSNGACFFNY